MPQQHPQPQIDPARQHELEEILTELQTLGFCLPGSVQKRYIRCQNPRCRCHHDPPQLHGPYIAWTRKLAGKTVTHNLTPEQADRYSPWFADNQRLHQLTTQLHALSLHAAEQAEGWGEK